MLNNPDMGSDEDQDKDVHDRGIPSVNERSSGKRNRIIAILLISALIIGGAIAYLKIRGQKHQEAQKPKVITEKTSSVPRKTFEFFPEVPTVIPTSAVADTVVPATKPIPLKDPMKENRPIGEGGDTAMTRDDTVVEIPVDPRLSSPIFIEVEREKSGSNLTAEGLMNTAATIKSKMQLDDDESGDDGPLNEQLKPTVTQAKNANFTPKRDYLLPKGTIFPCNMDTSLDTTVAGMVRCRVAKNVYSDSGRVLLIEKGSEATGEYQSNAKQGQSRIYVLWNSVRTPNGIEVPLDSPSADQLGGMGVPGYVDTHFWQRFGGAMLISVAGDALSILKSQGTGGSSPVVYNNTSSQANQMSQEALRNTINIPPTIYTNQGERIQIYVARNISFESVYHVK